MNIHPLILLSFCAALLTACSGMSPDARDAAKRGQVIYAKECSQCHGTRGEGAGTASLGLGVAPPGLNKLKQRNDGYFPRDYVRRFVMGVMEKDNPDSPMPEFAYVGLQHVYPKGGADGEVLEADFEGLLDYLEAIQD